MSDAARTRHPAPAGPRPFVASPDPGPAPSPVRTAVLLVWVLLVVDAVGATASTLSWMAEAREGARALDPTLSSEAVAGDTTALLLGGVVGLVLTSALYAVVAVQLRAGCTWPRTVLVVLTVMAVLGALIPGPWDPLTLAWSVVSTGLLVAALVLLLRPASCAWLAAWRAVRADAKRRRVPW